MSGEQRFGHVVEIGAGDSRVSLGGPLHVRADRVSLYEPNILLRKDLVRAAAGIANIEVLPFAVADVGSTRSLYHFGYASYLEGASSFLALAEPVGIDPTFWHPLVRPVEVVSMADIDDGKIDVLILTANGSEAAILSQLKSRPQIIRTKVYLHNAAQGEYGAQIVARLKILGYTKIVSVETNEHSTYHQLEARLS